jgi:hypothetical protein
MLLLFFHKVIKTICVYVCLVRSFDGIIAVLSRSAIAVTSFSPRAKYNTTFSISATSHHLFKKICWKMLVNLMTSIIGFMCRLAHSVQPIRLYPILMSILFHHYKQLSECISQVEQMTNKVEALQKGVNPPSQSKLFDFCKNT